MKQKLKVKLIGEITVLDPDENSEVELTIYKMSNGAVVGIDSSFLSNTDEPVFSPYDKQRIEMDIEKSEDIEINSNAFEFKIYSTMEEFNNRKSFVEMFDYNSYDNAKRAALNCASGLNKPDAIIKIQSKDREHIKIMNIQGKAIVNF